VKEKSEKQRQLQNINASGNVQQMYLHKKSAKIVQKFKTEAKAVSMRRMSQRSQSKVTMKCTILSNHKIKHRK
jgi:hypothetical protein